MAESFDPAAAGAALAAAVADTRSSVGTVKPPTEWTPPFHTLEDGTVVNQRGQKLRGPIEKPAAGKPGG